LKLSRKEQAFEARLRKKLAVWDQRSPFPGIAACAALTALAYFLHSLPFAPFTLEGGQHPLDAVLLALLLGLALRNLVPATASLKTGVNVVIKKLLPFGIVLLGAGLDFYDLIRVGFRVLSGTVVLIAIVVLATVYLARFFNLAGKQGLLIGVGTAICGSSAIVATAPVVESKEEDIAISLASINLLGALSMLAFPLLGAFLGLGPLIYGEWCGLAIHATPQVIAAGFAHHFDGAVAGEIATIVKLTRISLLGPTVFIIGALYARQRRKETVFVEPSLNYSQLLPTFVFFFVGMAVLKTAGFLPEVTFHWTERFLFGAGDRTVNLAEALSQAGKWTITAAIAGVGLITEFRALRTGGMRPFLLGLLASLGIALLGLAYSHWR